MFSDFFPRCRVEGLALGGKEKEGLTADVTRNSRKVNEEGGRIWGRKNRCVGLGVCDGGYGRQKIKMKERI